MTMLENEFLTAMPIPWQIVVLRLVGASIFCGLIGLEREVKSHAAGLRTNMLIGLGAAVFTIAAQYMVEHFSSSGDSVRMDPIRLIEAATAGVAFLAAGTIVLSQGRVKNVTTGALMWVSAAIGLSVGLGLWILALATTVLALIISAVLSRLDLDS
ncbi:MgtC/SapB family protein [Amaricoccus solimangrovi]|uniref:Protein MgtC n=2 Tax=Amaricoccus solimangrovi TaxID=2589815 RepID=A0A501WZJ4_9RHOB|nr:MgtC/SapB family protein [Amaricoccus solimangrovi]